MSVPTDNTESDTKNGFIVVKVGNVKDESEFACNSYAWARCYVTAYIPKKTRGRLNKALYQTFEDGIENVIMSEIDTPTSNDFSILEDSVLSMDDEEQSEKGNQYHVFVKSFIVLFNQK